jgi:hypothetical protein
MDRATLEAGYRPVHPLRYGQMAYKLAKEGPLWLICFCAPAPCHCDRVKQRLEAELA